MTTQLSFDAVCPSKKQNGTFARLEIPSKRSLVESEPKVIVIIGQTASGKSALSIQLAHAIDSVIISADSFQIYRDFGVASDKISMDERQGIRHFGIDIVDADSEYNVAKFIEYAIPIIDSELGSGRSPIVVGGTHMYVEKLLFTSRLDEEDPVAPQPTARSERDYSHAHLREIDPPSAATLHPKDHRRVSRAVDYFYDTGVRLSESLAAQKRELRWSNAVVLVKRGSVDDLEGRVSRRIETKMVSNGALRQELQKIKDHVQQGKLRWNKGLLQAIGYREFEPFVTNLAETGTEDEELFSKGVEDLVRNTIRYAKKQLKWIKKIASMVHVIYVDSFDEDLVNAITAAPPLKMLQFIEQ